MLLLKPKLWLLQSLETLMGYENFPGLTAAKKLLHKCSLFHVRLKLALVTDPLLMKGAPFPYHIKALALCSACDTCLIRLL